ncbi:MAG: AAA family ATPase, partial [Saprospiraceae bacterium]|nr:AAA family ATPase [Saprospiraceae bacterium]
PKLKGFNLKDIENFHNIYSTLQPLEKTYLNHYIAFTAREQSLAKTGEHGINKSNGHAAMWLENESEKKERFALLSGLTITDNHSDQEDAYLVLSRNPDDNNLVNFRTGDIGVLYPTDQGMQRPVLSNQIFKCSITNLTSDAVVIRLRNKQYNQSLFKTEKRWNIEQDSLDSSFNTMFKSMFTWASAPLEFRQLILGQRIPQFKEMPDKISFGSEVTAHQAVLLNLMLATKDYFLLWGPPGTGKTSIMLKNLVLYLHDHTKETILLLAYTNRAVDEICDAVLSIHPDFRHKFLRLGSRIGTGENYSEHLLDQVIKEVTSRQEIIQLLAERRIYISTVSSIINRVDLFHLKNFDTVIIDEASQILEPMLLGLLSRFRRFMLIGDHKQLPAVVTQPGYDSKIKNEILLETGFTDTRTSLFERLFMQISKNNWLNAIGILGQQGRMHRDLMSFPNQYFYEGKLELLPGHKRLTATGFFEKSTLETEHLAYHRTIYINTPEDEDINWKTNIFEANASVEIIEKLIALYKLNDKMIRSDSIGIITPYRAQIALIRQCMDRLPQDITNNITVDTVERYQGGARDIIILSFCVNRYSQLATLISPSAEGIDRKLNVALTRAREHIILIGNRDLLSQNEVYAKLLDEYVSI